MNAYIYRADLLCEFYGQQVRDWLTEQGRAPADPNNEHTYDSDDFPKGPYPNGGGEADSPQHCMKCDVFLENPLTSEGMEYVREELHPEPSETVKMWAGFYGIK